MAQISTRLRALAGDEQGQDLMEYGLLASLIAVVVVSAVRTFGASTNEVWAEVVAMLQSIT